MLALAVYRLCRLAGWDTFPPIARARAWVVGLQVATTGSTNARMGVTNEAVQQTVTFRRPLLAEFLGCAFCLGFWLSVLVVACWRLEPDWTLRVCFVLALSATAGLIAKQLDP